MTAGAPWSVKGIDPKAREIAKDLARRSGMTLGEWLNQMIMDDGVEPPSMPPAPEPRFSERPSDPRTESRGRFDALGYRRTPPPPPRLRAEPMEEDEIARVTEALDRLSARIEQAEHRSTLAISGIDQSVVGVLARIETAERQQTQVAARFEGAIDEALTGQETLEARLKELERARSGARSAEALKGLETALTRVAGHLYEGEGRTRDALNDIRRDVDTLADKVQRVDRANDPSGASGLVEQVVERIAVRLEQAEGRTTAALKALEGSFAHLDQRVQVTEARLKAGDEPDRRFEMLAADLTQKVEQSRAELAERLKSSADTRFDRVEGVLREMTGHVQAAEQRSAQAIERMGQEVVRISDTLTQRVQGVESRSAAAINQVGGDVSRMADAMEGRMKRADATQAEALEKLGAEIARITERLAERIANAERRSAQSMDDVGEQVARVTDRLQQRQERASSELVDRMRQSEERTAKLLEDARDKIDRRLNEAQNRLAEQAAALAPPMAPPSPYADPFGPAGGYAPMGYASSEPFAQDYGYTPPFAAPPQGFPDETDAAPEPEFEVAASASDLATPPVFAPADLEAAEAFDPADDFMASDFSPAEALAPESEGVEERDEDEDDGIEPYAPAAETPQPFAEPQPARNSSTQELIAQARAAARAAAAPPEPKSKKGGGAKAAGQSSSLFSGFGIGRKKAKGEGSTLKTAMMMSAMAAFLGLGSAGVVLMNGGAIAGWSNDETPADKPSADSAKVVADGRDALLAPATPIEPRLAVAMTPNPAMAPAAPSAEAQVLYSAAVAQIESDDRNGLEPLRRAANLGYAPAQYYLAKLYEDGKAGLKKDLPEARRWTERAAANGEPRAMHNLATFYYYGEGGPQNSAAAVDWFKKAANLGWVDSQFNLAVLNEKGLGVRQNSAEAYKWFLIAGRNGDEPSRGKVVELKKILSPGQLAAAESAAAAFRAETPNASARATAPDAAGGGASAAQRTLSRLGYYQGPLDGNTSPALRLAIQAYQRDQGLPASGELTPELVQRFASATR